MLNTAENGIKQKNMEISGLIFLIDNTNIKFTENSYIKYFKNH